MIAYSVRQSLESENSAKETTPLIRTGTISYHKPFSHIAKRSDQNPQNVLGNSVRYEISWKTKSPKDSSPNVTKATVSLNQKPPALYQALQVMS
jgi:hypothetical protein